MDSTYLGYHFTTYLGVAVLVGGSIQDSAPRTDHQRNSNWINVPFKLVCTHLPSGFYRCMSENFS